MIFNDMRIVNFLSFADASIKLADQGLVLITGENKDSNTADSNGAGKSTIFEALVWALWGKTTRGQSGDSVVNRKAGKDCFVEMTFSDGDQTYYLSRARKHSKLKNRLELEQATEEGPLNPLTQATTAKTQELINEILGIDYETFIRGPMLPQGSTKKFSQLTDSEVKAVLETALQVGVLSKAHTKINDKHSKVTQRVVNLTNQLQDTGANLSRAVEEKARWLDQKEKWFADAYLRLYRALRRICEAQDAVDDAWDDILPPVDVSESLRARDRVVALGRQKYQAWSEVVEEHRELEDEASGSVKVASADIERLTEEIKRIKSLGEESVCPTCRQEISEEHTSSCTIPIQTLLEHAEATHVTCREEEDKLRDRSAALQREGHDLDEKIREYRQKAEQRVVEVTTHAAEQKERDKILTVLEERLSDARGVFQVEQTNLQQGNPTLTAIEGIEEEIETLTQLKKNIEKELQAEEKGRAHLAFWLEGFSNRGLKSHILATVTPFMNRQAQVYGQELTDGEIEIKFNTQTQLAGGEWREKFSVDVSNENGADNYNGNSGGEKAKADLAINWTISDVVAARAKKPYPQRWFDEPFESLDEAGVEAVMDLLTKMVKECGTIFVVTHHPGMQALFNKTITVTKENGESRVA